MFGGVWFSGSSEQSIPIIHSEPLLYDWGWTVDHSKNLHIITERQEMDDTWVKVTCVEPLS